jgi:hypothetical protein
MKKLLIYSLAIATFAWSLSFAFISPVNAATINDGDVIKLATSPAVYYVTGGKKMLMPNRGVYSSWSSAIGDQNDKFATLRVVSDTDFGSLPFGPNMTVRPGTGLVKFTDSNDLFAIGYDNKLYKLYNENTKNVLYPNATIITLTESFRANYYEYSNPVAVLTANSTYPDGTLIKDANQSVVYLVENGQRRFMTPDIFSSNGFKNQWVETTDISKYQQGADLKGQRDQLVVPLATNGYRLINNFDGGYKIECPRSWNLYISQFNKKNALFGPSATASSGLGGVEVSDFSGSSEDYLKYLKANTELSSVTERAIIVANNTPAFEVTRANGKGFSVIFSANGRGYNIYINSTDLVNKEYFDAIVGTFSFITVDSKDIIDAFKRKYPSRDYSSLTVTINKNHQDLFVQGSIFSVGDTGGVFWAAKVNGVWQIVFDGQDSPPCSTLNSYNFPDEMLSGCY